MHYWLMEAVQRSKWATRAALEAQLAAATPATPVTEETGLHVAQLMRHLREVPDSPLRLDRQLGAAMAVVLPAVVTVVGSLVLRG